MLRFRPPRLGIILSRSMGACLFLLVLFAARSPLLSAESVVDQPPAPERVIVQLEALSLLAARIPLSEATDDALYASALAQRDLVGQRIMDTVPGAEVEATFGLAFSGLSVRVPLYDDDTIDELLRIPGVLAVYPETKFHPAAYESMEIIRAPLFWQHLGGRVTAGQDVRIAVIDSGIAIGHPMFDPAGWSYPPGYPRGWAVHTSPKVIAARAYFRPTDPPVAGEETPVPGVAGSPHGTHAAGVAAGNPVTTMLYGANRTLSGVAPGAFLMNYRIFYPSASDGVERAYTTEILRALEDAIADGAHVLLNSWSGEPATAYMGSPIQQALQAASQAGIVVVAPAGNEGPGRATAGRLPGGLATSITVGIQGAPYGRALFGSPIEQDIGPLPVRPVSDVAPDESPYACAPLPAGSLTQQAALISRGECPFANKAYYAQQAGASLVLIYNTTESVTEMACVGPYCEPGVITVPVAMLSQGLGEQLLAWWALPGGTPHMTLGPAGRVLSDSPELVAPASGRGPAYMSLLKPDFIAPGVGVVSAGLDAGYVALSGSSVSAGHVAGAAAGLLQANPTWGHTEVKAALMATARTGEPGALDQLPPWTSVLDRGAGLVDLPRAIAPLLRLDPPSLSQPALTASVSRETVVQVRDLRTAGAPLAWQVEIEASAGLDLTGPGSLTTSPGATVPLPLIWQTDASHEGDVEAMVVLRSDAEIYRLPAWGYVHPMPEAGRILLLANDVEFAGGFTDTRPAIEATLNALGVTYDVWDADALFGAEQTLPDPEALLRYDAILWTLGEKRNPDGTFAQPTPPTSRDQQLLMSYLDAGGRLLVMGQNVARATDIDSDPDPVWGRSALYHGYLGAHWLQDDVFGGGGAPPETIAVTGLAGSFLQGLALDLGPVGVGAGNQHSIDELGLGGSPQGYDAPLVQPVAAALSSAAMDRGLVMIAKADGPTLENPEPRISYRVLHQSFGLEGINERPGVTTATELLRRQLNWLLGEVAVDVLDDLVGGPFGVTRLEAIASSTVGASMVSYRWRIIGGGETRLIESHEPVIYLTLDQVGTYALTVEVTDDLGHSALGHGSIRIVAGGASGLTVNRPMAAPGDSLVYALALVNSEPSSLSASFTLPLPAHTTYLSHMGDGVQWVGNALQWSGTLAAGETMLAELRVAIDPETPVPLTIEATAQFVIDGVTFERQAATLVSGERRYWLPGIMPPIDR